MKSEGGRKADVAEVDPWMTPTDAMRSLGVTLPTVHAMVSRGELESDRIAGRQVISRESVENAKQRRSDEQAQKAAVGAQ